MQERDNASPSAAAPTSGAVDAADAEAVGPTGVLGGGGDGVPDLSAPGSTPDTEAATRTLPASDSAAALQAVVPAALIFMFGAIVGGLELSSMLL